MCLRQHDKHKEYNACCYQLMGKMDIKHIVLNYKHNYSHGIFYK